MVEFVQVRLLLNRSDPFPEKIVRERLTWASAFYGERLRDIVFLMVGYSCLLRGGCAGLRLSLYSEQK